jgi:hypothetical protein
VAVALGALAGGLHQIHRGLIAFDRRPSRIDDERCNDDGGSQKHGNEDGLERHGGDLAAVRTAVARGAIPFSFS